MINSRKEAFKLLQNLGAPPRLIRHLELVSEAADELIGSLESLNIPVDKNFVRLGVVIHDAGKIIHPNEIVEKGSHHEPDGEKLLLKHGVQAEIARCCLSHARYASMTVSFEELLVALSDKLWKGKRVETLELRIIDAAAKRIGKDRWDLFEKLDSAFEDIARLGHDRLSRSQI